MTIPANLPFRTLVGIYHRRKEIRQQQTLAWLELIATVLPAIKPGLR